MAQRTINIGSSANKGDGDPIRTAFGKVNDNFTELYGKVAVLEDGTVAQVQDTKGSIFGDDSTLLVDAVNSNIPAANLSGALPAIDGSALTGISVTETDPVVGAINGLVKADGAGNISQAVAGTDYLTSETFTEISQDTTPELGGNLATNGKMIQFGHSGGLTENRLTFSPNSGFGFPDPVLQIFANSGTGFIQHQSNAGGELRFKTDKSQFVLLDNSKIIEITANGMDIVKGALKLPVYADPTARDTALPNGTVEEGMVVYLQDLTGSSGTQGLQLNTDGTTTGWVNI